MNDILGWFWCYWAESNTIIPSMSEAKHIVSHGEIFLSHVCVRRTPNFPVRGSPIPNFLQNPATLCNTLWFCVIIYTKVTLSHTTDGPLSMCCILSTLIIPSPIPFLCCSIATPMPFYSISTLFHLPFPMSSIFHIPLLSPFHDPLLVARLSDPYVVTLCLGSP